MKQVQIKTRPPMKGRFNQYLGVPETAILIELVRSVTPKVMIEFGCNLGITARNILDNVPSIEKYIGIDVPFDHIPTLDCQRSEVPREAGIYANDDRFKLLSRPSREIRPDQLEWADAIFIDGDHSYDAVVHESRLAWDLIRPGGIIIWHDYNNPTVDVTKVLNQFYNGGWPISSVENSWLAFMRVGAK
jgi:predicted O-methyltransferase YrrM